jgi:hypothetical protein
LAVSSALWSSLCGLGRLLFSSQSNRLSSSSVFLQSITQLTLADWPQPVSSSLGLSAPSALARIEGPLVVSLPDSLGCAFRVWLPSWRLTPFGPWAVLFHTASTLGVRPSELVFLPGIQNVSALDEPTYRFSCRCFPAPKHRAGPTGRGSWVFTLPGDPIVNDGFSTAVVGQLPWASPFQGTPRRP